MLTRKLTPFGWRPDKHMIFPLTWFLYDNLRSVGYDVAPKLIATLQSL